MVRRVTESKWSPLVLGIALAIASVAVWLRVQTLDSDAAGLTSQVRVLQVQQSALASYLDSAQQQLKQHGIPPAQPPPAQVIAQAGPPGAQGPAGAQGPGPSDTQVQAAVQAYLTVHPIAEQPPTDAQVAAVVAVYMTQHPPAPGPTGSVGATGAQGPPPTDAQIAAAVATWEQAHPAPSGPQGPSGPPGPSGVGATGPQGPPGPSGSGATGPQGPPGSPGPACPSGYQPTPEKINGNNAVVCEQPSSSPSPSPTPSGIVPTVARRTTSAAGSSPTSRTWPLLLLSAVLVWPPEKRWPML